MRAGGCPSSLSVDAVRAAIVHVQGQAADVAALPELRAELAELGV